MSNRQNHSPLGGVGATDPAPDIEFDIAIVDGEAGRRLAPRQAEAILAVLSWLCEQTSNPHGEAPE